MLAWRREKAVNARRIPLSAPPAINPPSRSPKDGQEPAKPNFTGPIYITNSPAALSKRPAYLSINFTLPRNPHQKGNQKDTDKKFHMAGRSSTSSHPSRRTSSPTDLNSNNSSSSPTKSSKDSLRREIEGIEAEASKLRAELASLRQERKILATVVQSWPGKGMSVL